MNHFKDDYERWLDKAYDYPTKLLIMVAMDLYQEQAHFIELHKGKLDGMAWSPEAWSD